MFEHGISAKWLRRANWATSLFFGSFAVGGLWYVFASALSRDVLGAVIGAGVVWGSLGLGIGMHCVTQMAGVVDANVRAVAHKMLRTAASQFHNDPSLLFLDCASPASGRRVSRARRSGPSAGCAGRHPGTSSRGSTRHRAGSPGHPVKSCWSAARRSAVAACPGR